MKPRVSQLAQSGATGGQVITWNATTLQYEPATGGAAGTTKVGLPLTTVVAGAPELVWDSNNSLIYTEGPP